MEYIQIYESIVIEFLRQITTVIHCAKVCNQINFPRYHNVFISWQ